MASRCRSIAASIATTPRDVIILFAARVARMASYGALATVLLRYLGLLLSDEQVGGLLLGIILRDLAITLLLTSNADRVGRRRTLQLGAALKMMSGVVFAMSSSFPVLLVAGILGVISPTGGEIGPFLAIEQSCLADAAKANLVAGSGSNLKEAAAVAIASIFGYYNAIGYAALAAGGAIGGVIVSTAQSRGDEAIDAFRRVLFLYAVLGGVKFALYSMLTPSVEVDGQGAGAAPTPKDAAPTAAAAAPQSVVGRLKAFASNLATLGLRRPESRRVVSALSCLFAVDAFAGGFVMQTWIVLWFARRWGTGDGVLGGLLAAANIAAGISGASAGYLVKRFGAVETMVFTHLPSNLLLMAVPLMPTAPLAAAVLVARFTISQMDVPARQAYVASVVASDERSAAGGVTNIVRSIGLAVAPLPLAALTAAPSDSFAFSAPFFIAGVLKCIYDITLYIAFVVSSRRAAAAASDGSAGAATAVQGVSDGSRPGVAAPAPPVGTDGKEAPVGGTADSVSVAVTHATAAAAATEGEETGLLSPGLDGR